VEKTVKFPESTPMKQFLKITHVQSVYYTYPIKFDFERGSGTENHEIYYFISYIHDFWILIIELYDFLKFYHVLIVLIRNCDYVPYFHMYDTTFIQFLGFEYKMLTRAI